MAAAVSRSTMISTKREKAGTGDSQVTIGRCSYSHKDP